MRSSRLVMSSTKYRLSSLPLPKNILTNNLTPDTNTPDVHTFLNSTLTKNPSIQRRARLLPSQSHFSFVTPFPQPFPYAIEPPEIDDPEESKGAYVERWLADREPIISELGPNLRKYSPKSGLRDQRKELIGFAETALRDCLPHLDVGDTFRALGTPSLMPKAEEPDVKADDEARQEILDILSGHSALISDNFAPWSIRYSGHQFGNFAGQLGDGRAISIHVVQHPTDPKLSYELQLKGSGRTPFSRSADGLAVVRSSIREFLCSEAMKALDIPTTRALSIVSLPDLPVVRERQEAACVLTRIAPSFLRIGNFEAFSPPGGEMFFFGGGQQSANYEGLRILGEWVADNVLGVRANKDKPWGEALVMEVAKRNAKMVAAWQAYGFMHGVINTDNVSILGLTIDYGPYAFMDVFDHFHICNHSDDTGRYAYMFQPNMIIYALRALLNALAPLIGAERKLGKAVTAGWASTDKGGKTTDASNKTIEKWRQAGLDAVKDKMERMMQEATSVEYGRLMRKRLGLKNELSNDESKLFKPFLDLMEDLKLDFHASFRQLCYFRPSLAPDQFDEFVCNILACAPDADVRYIKGSKQERKAREQVKTFLEAYSKRINSELDKWNDDQEQRQNAMLSANPRFVLRQWVLESVIAAVERDADNGKRILAKVLHMATNPFEPWGNENELDEEMDEEMKEEKRYCGFGDKKMLGFQCSCSS